jgi:hypothetical protein
MKTRTINNADGTKILIAGEEIIFVPVGSPVPQLKPSIFRKLWVFLFGGFLSVLFAIQSHAATVTSGGPLVSAPTYVSVVRVTATGSALAGTKLYAFQNTSATADVVIRKIEIANASTMTITGGTMQFWVYGSTQFSHSALITTGFSYSTAAASQPSFVKVSSAPLSVQYEGDAAVQVGGGLLGTPPIIRPLYINNDEAAVALLYDSWSEESLGHSAPLLLPKATNRGIVIDQKRLGTTDFSDGAVYIRIFYTIH